MSIATQTGEIIVAGKKLIEFNRAAELLGLKSASLSTGISRGDLALTRYYGGRRPRFDLAEIERVITDRAIPAGQRKRRR